MHKLWHQLSIAFHLCYALHSSIEFTTNSGRLLVSRVELCKRRTGKKFFLAIVNMWIEFRKSLPSKRWTEFDVRTFSRPKSVETYRKVVLWLGCSRCWVAACVSVACVRHHLAITNVWLSSRHPVWSFELLTCSLQNTIKLCHPRCQHRFLTQPVDFWQRSHSLFDVIAEHLAEVVLRTGATRDHLLNTIRFEENVMVRLNSVLKCFVGHNLRFSLHKSLKAIRYRVEILLGDFLLSLSHVVRLFTVERIRDASRYEHVKLNSSFALFLFDLMSFGKLCWVFGLLTCKWRRRRGWTLKLLASKWADTLRGVILWCGREVTTGNSINYEILTNLRRKNFLIKCKLLREENNECNHSC